MRLIDIITTASSNMFRSKLRTSLTIMAIFIGAFTLTLTNGLGSGINKYIDKQLGNLGAADVLVIQATGDATGLPSDEPKKYDPSKRTTAIEAEGNRTVTVLTDKDIAKIKATPGIKSAEPYLSAAITYITGQSNDKYVGSVNQYLSGANYALEAGQLPNNDAKDRQTTLPTTYLKGLGYSNASEAVGKIVKFGVTDGFGKISEVTAFVTGVEEKALANGGSININRTLLTELRRVQHTGLPVAATTGFQAATARFDTTLSEEQVKNLKEQLKKAGYAASTVQDQIGTFKSVINAIIMVLNGFAIIALLAASFGIINTLLMSVQERTKEIGLMKAMGMGAGRIFLLFSAEAVMLGFWGSLLGSLVAIGVGSAANQIALTTFLKDLDGLQLLAFSPGSVAAIMGIVMAIAFFAGTLPAIRAARQNPIDSLRYE